MSLPKIKITRAGGYDPVLGPQHPANRDLTLEVHVIGLENRGLGHSQPHRWVCSCKRSGRWQQKIRSARTGGVRHVAAMERG